MKDIYTKLREEHVQVLKQVCVLVLCDIEKDLEERCIVFRNLVNSNTSADLYNKLMPDR